MPFERGTPKPAGSGRKKGTPNKLTREAVIRLEELGCDPIEGMARIASNRKNSPELRGKMYAELAQYVYPKRRAVDYVGPEGNPRIHEQLREVVLVALAPYPEARIEVDKKLLEFEQDNESELNHSMQGCATRGTVAIKRLMGISLDEI